jgi:hypothetical protein
MHTLGIVIVAIFGTIFAGFGLYLLIDYLRTGELFRQKKLVPVAMGAGVIAVIGVYLVSLD